MASFKDMLDIGLDIGSVGMEIKNWSRLSGLARGGISTFLGGKKMPPTESTSSTTSVEENRMQEGELYAFLGYLSALHSGDGKKITEYQVGVGEERIFPRIVKAMKPGAGALLMRTLGVSTTTVKARQVVGYAEHTVDGKTRRDPITEETVKTVNLTGPQITSALTYLATQGAGTDEEKIRRVIEDLDAFRLFESKLDTAKALGAKSAEELKRLTGWLDTHAHVVLAIVTLGPKKLQNFLDSPICERHLAAIKAEGNLDQKRLLQERFQAVLVAESERVNVLVVQEEKAQSQRFWFGAAIIIALLFIAVIIGPNIPSIARMIG